MANMSVIKKVASNCALPKDHSTMSAKDEQQSLAEKIAILAHHEDEYVVNAESRLTGDVEDTIQQLETIGYKVISINPNMWKSMSMSSSEEKIAFLSKQLELNCSDNANKQTLTDLAY